MPSRSRPPFIGVCLSLLSVLPFAACGKKTEPAVASSSGLTPVVVQLDWVPEPEHGGLFQAQAKGWFKAAGLDVTLVPGGANTFGPQKVATGQAQIGQSDSTTTLLAIAQNLPIVHVGAVFQNDPSVLMLHADNPVRTFEELEGKTVMARPEWAFIPYLKKQYGVSVKLIPQNFQVANFIADSSFIQQGFYIAEPFHIIGGGAKPPKFLYVWDAGFDAYTVLFANKPWARAHPEAMKAFMAAYIAGWRDYLTGDPQPAHALIKAANPSASDAFLAWSREQIIRERLVIGRERDPADLSQVGRIAAPRFARQIEILEQIDAVPKGRLTPEMVMAADYLPEAGQ